MISLNPFVNRLTVDLMSNPYFLDLISPNFINKPKKERQKIYNYFPALTKTNITLKDIEYISQDLQFLKFDFIFKEIIKIVLWIIENQDEDGSWSLLTKRNLVDFRQDNPDEILAINDYFDKNPKKNNFTSNAWITSLTNLILSKFLLLISGEKLKYFLLDNDFSHIISLLDEIDQKKVQDKILSCRTWLNNNRNEKDGFSGWGPLPAAIYKESLNSYDTSFGYISAHYGKGLVGMHEATMPTELNALQPDSPFYDNATGAWRAEEGQPLDPGATSYAILSVLKFRKDNGQYPVGFNFELINKAIKWLIDQQQNGGCWGRSSNGPPRVDRTCHCLMALLKYEKAEKKNAVPEAVYQGGINFLKSKIITIENYINSNGIIFCWLNDGEKKGQHPCFRNSSLAISTLLRFFSPSAGEIQRGISSLLRLYKHSHKRSSDRLTQPDELYFWCMLLNYTKALVNQDDLLKRLHM